MKMGAGGTLDYLKNMSVSMVAVSSDSSLIPNELEAWTIGRDNRTTKCQINIPISPPSNLERMIPGILPLPRGTQERITRDSSRATNKTRDRDHMQSPNRTVPSRFSGLAFGRPFTTQQTMPHTRSPSQAHPICRSPLPEVPTARHQLLVYAVICQWMMTVLDWSYSLHRCCASVSLPSRVGQSPLAETFVFSYLVPEICDVSVRLDCYWRLRCSLGFGNTCLTLQSMDLTEVPKI
ncbi:hypothetical protein F4801DRAFT_309535 [Xylaria longipes]|nr:hypothetical protein F4801DRAFT_309535 [Xylaria longipes]